MIDSLEYMTQADGSAVKRGKQIYSIHILKPRLLMS